MTPIASRLVTDLMLVNVLVAGQGAEELADALSREGVAAETLSGAHIPAGFDLVILLVGAGGLDDPGMADFVADLARASERLLFAPLPLGQAAGAPALPELTRWFELFAELGYQPVVDFDAGFVSAGAFLVDRAATAAESELAAFAERLQFGQEAAGVQREAVQEADRVSRADRDALRAALEEREADLRAVQTELAAAQAALHDAADRAARDAAALAAASAAAADNSGWEGLRGWVYHAVRDAARDTEAALARELPLLNALRSAYAPPLALPPLPPAPKPGLFASLFGLIPPAPPVPPPPLLADTALVRASPLFDAAWYIASNPELAEAALDPVFHYVLVGSLRGADPGPWFDTAAYLRANPAAGERGICPLLHAIRSGAASDMITALPG